MSAPACWGWKDCPENPKEGPLACACLTEAKRRGRVPQFGDYAEAGTISKAERLKSTSVRKCRNYHAPDGGFL